MRAGLAEHVLGARVAAVQVLHPRPVRRDPGGPQGFADRVVGHHVTAVRRRGKYFWLALDERDAVLAHLGMSGQMLLKAPGAPDDRHLRVRFTLSGVDALSAPDGVLEMRFVDQRMFGGLTYSAGGGELPAEIGHIALDPLDPQFDAAAVVAAVRRRTSAIKRLLLNQDVVSGIGNIYADEALWRARVHPERRADSLSGRKVGELLEHARGVMADALAQGGTSFDALYVNVNGESGYFDRSLCAYGREGEPCERCGQPIRRAAFMNRSSYFCPRCQRKR